MSDPSRDARMAESIRAYWGAYSEAPGGVHAAVPGLSLNWTPIPHAIMNTVILDKFDAAATEDMIARVAKMTAAQGVGATWHVLPPALDDGAREALAAAGCTDSGSTPAMLRALDGFAAPALPEGLTIEEANGPEGRRLWGGVTARAFGFSEEDAEAFAACEAAIPDARVAAQRRYLGRLDGEPVAVSCLAMAAGYAGIYAVATMPEARGLGVGAAMTGRAMAAGAALGAEEAVLQATDMGFPVYRRLGFETAFEYRRFIQSP